MKCAPVRLASARLRCHCEISRALSKEISTICFGFAGDDVGDPGGSAKAASAQAREARQNARTRNERDIGKLGGNLGQPFGLLKSRLSLKCGIDAIRQDLRLRGIVPPIFRPAPFHADKFSLKRGAQEAPLPGPQWFLI